MQYTGYAYLRGLGDTTFDWGYNTVPQADALNLVKKWPRGKGLGGSGAVNGLYWCKGDQNEYDAWGRESEHLRLELCRVHQYRS